MTDKVINTIFFCAFYRIGEERVVGTLGGRPLKPGNKFLSANPGLSDYFMSVQVEADGKVIISAKNRLTYKKTHDDVKKNYVLQDGDFFTKWSPNNYEKWSTIEFKRDTTCIAQQAKQAASENAPNHNDKIKQLEQQKKDAVANKNFNPCVLHLFPIGAPVNS